MCAWGGGSQLVCNNVASRQVGKVSEERDECVVEQLIASCSCI